MLLNLRKAMTLLIAGAVIYGCGSNEVLFGPSGGAGGGSTSSQGGGGPGVGPGGGPGSGGQGGTPLTCGDGMVQPPEECDGTDLAGASCQDHGFSNPNGLVCTATCALDPSGCVATCDGQLLETGEDCDGTDLGTHSCLELGYSTANGMTCTRQCQLDGSGCMATCDGVLKEPGEVCDGTDLGGADCTMFGFSNPAGLGCDACQLDSSTCTPTCDGQLLEPGEDCDDGNNDPTDGCDNCVLLGGSCSTPIPVSKALGTQTFIGTTVGGGQHGTFLCANEENAPDRIYAVTAQTAGFLTASLSKPGTMYDSILYALTNCTNPGSGIWCTDNGSLADPNGGEALSFEMQQGQTVYIVVDGYLGASGTYELVLDLSVGTCADPVPIPMWQPGPTSGLGNTNNKPDNHTHSCGGSGSSDVVYEVTPQFTGNIDVRLPTASAGYDTVLAARTTCAQQATELGCSHVTGDDFFTVAGTMGVPFYAIVDGFNGANGEYRLRLDPF